MSQMNVGGPKKFCAVKGISSQAKAVERFEGTIASSRVSPLGQFSTGTKTYELMSGSARIRQELKALLAGAGSALPAVTLTGEPLIAIHGGTEWLDVTKIEPLFVQNEQAAR